jgi:hypothetical protein
MGDDVKMGLKEIGWECVDWVHLAEESKQWQAVVNMVVNLQVP